MLSWSKKWTILWRKWSLAIAVNLISLGEGETAWGTVKPIEERKDRIGNVSAKTVNRGLLLDEILATLNERRLYGDLIVSFVLEET